MTTFDPRALARATPLPTRAETPGAVLVALDGDPAGRPALEWAAAEAAVRGSALHVRRSVPSPLLAVSPWVWAHHSPWLWTYQPEVAEAALTAGRDELTAAVRAAHEVVPALDVFTDLVAGAAPASGLERDGAALVVVGRPRRSRRQPATVREALRPRRSRPRLPVVVVDLAVRGVDGPSVGRVVVALGARDDPAPVLETAYRAAARRGVGLTLLHAWGRGIVPDVVDEVLGPYQDVFPEVGVLARPVTSVARALAEESRGAALVVVAAPGRPTDVVGRIVSRRVVRAVACPVVLVPVEGARLRRTRAPRPR
ncbi:universal stress protein [Cellulosimicrobium protaetiae]|uniref:Universal stress protein n=1 Tax=Cellulosimicrobium protaetiae TaxID=2587808 RepID=A0A6M5UAM7_9MICO|nr:universal stress protein [Cellulosimicrobium protaetiae]QJW35154.1 universal stress protein [Cellulosimicrobium protaetiae]